MNSNIDELEAGLPNGLHDALLRLAAPCRELLIALYFDPEKPSYAEIAARFDRSVGGIGPTMLAGLGLVALSMVVMLRATEAADPLARQDLAFALSVILLGLLMMVTRRNAVSQVIGFLSIENGLILAATGAKGMPLVVEISVAFSVLVAFIVIGIFLFRIRERFDTVDIRALDQFRGERR